MIERLVKTETLNYYNTLSLDVLDIVNFSYGEEFEINDGRIVAVIRPVE